MAKVITLGIAAQDFVFSVDAFPVEPRKYRARDIAVTGGGCAATAAVAIARLGGDSHLVSRLGNDVTARIIVEDLEADGVDCSGVRLFEGCKSSMSAITVDRNGERLVMNYRDETIPADPGFVGEHISGADAVLADSRWPEGALQLFQLASEMNIPSVLDGEMPFGEGERAAVKLASHPVFSTQGLADYASEPDLIDGLLAANAMRDGRWTAVTDGANGVFIALRGRVHRLPGHEVAVVDTLGAGDVWHGAFALALAEGQSEENAIAFASAAAALKCTRFGGRKGTPDRQVLNEFLDSNSLRMELLSA
jgi:sulfofructose kinase